MKWIAGFFIPGGGFVKIVKAIVKAFQFVAANLDKIRMFFDSVFDSMEAATEGRTEGVASKIVTGLKMGVVLALDFLARQLGLDTIIGSVHKIIHALRRPIVSAIEWVLRKVKPLVTRIVRFAGGKKASLSGAHDLDRPVTLAHEAHVVRVQVEGARLRILMSSDRFKPVDDEIEHVQHHFVDTYLPGANRLREAEEIANHLAVIRKDKEETGRETGPLKEIT